MLNVCSLPLLHADQPQSSLDVNGMAGFAMVGPGSFLILSNLTVMGFAMPDAYEYGPGTPYKLAGTGSGVYPTLNIAPGGTVSREGVWHSSV
jgi:hypothetical protein